MDEAERIERWLERSKWVVPFVVGETVILVAALVVALAVVQRGLYHDVLLALGTVGVACGPTRDLDH